MSKVIVVVHLPLSGMPMCTHEKLTLSTVAEAIAGLKSWKFGGIYSTAHRYHEQLYFVPSDTLISDEALELGISTASRIFGGVVPYPFVKTKAITHQLVREDADRPEGWSIGFAETVHDSVLPGFTAFSAADARLAGRRLLTLGAIRLKDPLHAGGSGQTVITTAWALDEFLEQYPAEKIATRGLVLETDLQRSMTLSVGQVTIDDLMIAYHGTQRTVVNNEGQPVYGGSHIICARGGWQVLDELPMPEEVRLAVTQARSYDQAASDYFGFLASRRNYDVGQGLDSEGRWRSGVFEASWRSGGASTAELAALTEFARDPALQIVEVSAVKEYGTACEPPRGSVIHFHGDDPEDGPILRYTTIMPSSCALSQGGGLHVHTRDPLGGINEKDGPGVLTGEKPNEEGEEYAHISSAFDQRHRLGLCRIYQRPRN